MDEPNGPEDPTPETTPSFEVVDSNRYFVLGSDDDGYSIWRTDSDDPDPIRVFPATDEGSEEAFGTYRRMSKAERSITLTVTKWIVIVAAVAWALSGIALAVVYLGYSPEGPSSFDGLIKWSQALNAAAYPIAVGAGVVYGVLWLDARKGTDQLTDPHRASTVTGGCPRERVRTWTPIHATANPTSSRATYCNCPSHRCKRGTSTAPIPVRTPVEIVGARTAVEPIVAEMAEHRVRATATEQRVGALVSL